MRYNWVTMSTCNFTHWARNVTIITGVVLNNADLDILCRLPKVRSGALKSTVAYGSALGGSAQKRRQAQAGRASMAAAHKLSKDLDVDVAGEGSCSERS